MESLKHLISSDDRHKLANSEYIFGPVVRKDHWYCAVMEPRTHKFFWLDSLKGGREADEEIKNLAHNIVSGIK